MKYFVGTTLSTEVQWQLELMIESFKYAGIEDKLYIFISTDGKPKFHESFCQNLTSHKNLFIQPNYGKRKGYLPLNCISNLIEAMNKKILGDEFVILPTDCVIYKEPESIEENSGCKFQTDLLFSPEVINQKIDMLSVFEINPTEITTEMWPYATQIIQFKNFHVTFFEDLLYRTERYLFNQFHKRIKHFPKTIQTAINLHLKMYIGKYLPIQTTTMCNQLLDHEINNFVHYDTGYYPIFNKSMFKYNPVALADPFEILANNKPTFAFAYLSGLAENYLKKRNVQKNKH